MNDESSDFAPTASWSNLRRRAKLLQATRAFFDARDFLEVETPLLSADVVVDRHIDPIGVTLPRDPSRPQLGQTLWLQSSPEAAMKRMLAADSGPIFQLCKAFRAGESGALHNPEFTIVEWYDLTDSLDEAISLLSDLVDCLLGCGAAERISYRDAFVKFADIDPFDCTIEQLTEAVASANIAALSSLGDDRDLWLDLVMAERVGPRLGEQQPTVLFDFPAGQAMLSTIRSGKDASIDSARAERFELFYRGIELANGYVELRDADELRRRFEAANAARATDGKPTLPVDSRLEAAMRRGLPACSGAALGFDRTVMLAVGARKLADVMPFPVDRA